MGRYWLATITLACWPTFQNQVVESVEINNGLAAANVTTVKPDPLNPIVNGSFETGNLAGWTVKELTPASNPSLPISVRGAGVEYPRGDLPCASIHPRLFHQRSHRRTVGGAARFQRQRRGNDRLYQPPRALSGPHAASGTTTLEFDYRAAWELFRFGSTQDRTFDVEIEPAGGGPALLDAANSHRVRRGFRRGHRQPVGRCQREYPPGLVDLSAYAARACASSSSGTFRNQVRGSASSNSTTFALTPHRTRRLSSPLPHRTMARRSRPARQSPLARAPRTQRMATSAATFPGCPVSTDSSGLGPA